MKYIFPKRVVAFEGNVSNPEQLLKEKTLQVAFITTDIPTKIVGPAYIILDYGKELAGSLRIITYIVDQNNNQFRIRFGESVTETCSEIGEKGSTNDHAPRDMIVRLPFWSDLTFGPSGFRFVRIDVKEGQTLTLKSVVVKSDVDERPQTGYFKCNDELVNNIYDTAAYTMRLCLQNGYFWDGIKRDRLVWIGDSYPEAKSTLALFDNTDEVLNTLRFAMQIDVLPNWCNNMPTYDFWWLLILEEAYHHYLDKEQLKEFIPYFEGVIKQFEPCIDEDGTLKLGFNFVDWPSHYVEGESLDKLYDEQAGCEVLAKLTFIKSLKLAKEFNLTETVELLEKLIAKLNKKEHKFIRFKQHAGLAVFAGEQTKENEEVLLRNGAHGMSTFMSYFILGAICKYGHYEEALNIMKEYYGGMLSVGATSFWEDFDINWLENAQRIDEVKQEGKKDIHGDYGAFCYVGFRHSFCHGWSSGVVSYLVEEVAGLKQADDYSDTFVFEPHMSGLTDVECAIPTRHGLITVKNKLINGEVVSEINAPKEITIIRK